MAYVDTLFGHQSDVACVAGQRRERVVTVGRDRTCRFWKVAEDSQLIFRPAPGDGALESCAFASNDTWITGSDDGTVALWSTTKKRAVMSWKGIHGFGGAAVRGREDAGAEEDSDAGAEEDAKEDAGGIRARNFSTRAKSLARAERARLRRSSAASPRTNASLGVSGVGNAGRWVNAVACARGADVCASGAGDGAIRLWRVGEDAGRQLAPLWCLPARGFVNALAVASSGRFVLAGMGQEPRGGGGPGTRTRKTACSCTGSGWTTTREERGCARGAGHNPRMFNNAPLGITREKREWKKTKLTLNAFRGSVGSRPDRTRGTSRVFSSPSRRP